MSRGHGRVQREIIQALVPNGRGHRGHLAPSQTVRQLAGRTSSQDRHMPSEAELSAVRRALRGLVAEGVVEVAQRRPLRYQLTEDAAGDILREWRAPPGPPRRSPPRLPPPRPERPPGSRRG